MAAGLSLALGKTRSAVERAVIAIAVSPILAPVGDAYLSHVHLDVDPFAQPALGMIAKAIFQGALAAALSIAYLKNSKRVRNTYT